MDKRTFIIHYLLNRARAGNGDVYDYNRVEDAKGLTDKIGHLWHAANQSGAVEEEKKDP